MSPFPAASSTGVITWVVRSAGGLTTPSRGKMGSDENYPEDVYVIRLPACGDGFAFGGHAARARPRFRLSHSLLVLSGQCSQRSSTSCSQGPQGASLI